MSDTECRPQESGSETLETSVVPIEVLRMLDSILEPPPATGLGSAHPTTDIANAARFRQLATDRLLWVPDWSTWMMYDGQRWVRDEGALEAMRVAREITKIIMKEASTEENSEVRETLAKWSIVSGKFERLKAAVMLGRSEIGLSCLPSDFDRDPWLIGTKTGKLCLRSGHLTPSLPSDRLTRVVNVEYAPDATCPRWETFLREVFSGDQELIAYIQRMVGYCLTGSVCEQVFWVFWGMGANGKSVLAEVLRLILCDYYHRADPQLFVTGPQESRAGNASPHIAGLKGARLVIASETPPNGRLAETCLKELTGGDAITGRFLYGNPFTFAPSHKLVLLTNHKPRVSQDTAVWRRMRLVPFNQVFPPEKQDRYLLEKLKAELPGILAWAVRGAIDWAKDGLAEPKSVKEATAEYRSSEDVVGRFVEERCVIDSGAVSQYSDLYKAFIFWSHENSEPEYGNPRFASELESRGFPSKKGAKGVRLRSGIRLREAEHGRATLGSAVFDQGP